MDTQTNPNTTGPPRDPRGPSSPLIGRAPPPLVEVQGSAHTVSAVNAAFCRLLGKSSRELIGKPFAEIVQEGAACVAILDRVRKTRATTAHAEHAETEATSPCCLHALWPALDANESPVAVIISLAPAATFHQHATAVNEALLIAGLHQHELTEQADTLNAQLQIEISERELAETALHSAIVDLRQAQVSAERASRAKDGFLAALSHELRTPLTPVLMAAAALREDERLPTDIREQLGMMERNIALEARLIDDLLDLTKISQGKLQFNAEPCDAHHLISRAIEIVQGDARAKEISIERAFTAANSRLVADPARFQQVIWNLLRNALKFTPRGGRVSIRTYQGERIGSDITWLHVEVADTGIGIDPARLEQIFEPFDQGELTGDHRYGGVGLGLAIARAVVLLHGGRIHAESAGKAHGATFVVDLPGMPGQQPGIIETNSADAAGSSVDVAPVRTILPRRILLVEDHENTRQTLNRLLQRDGHHVVATATVAEALAAATTVAFDLVVSDLGLPDGSGTDVMEKLRAAYGLRGIALSGYGTDDDISRSRAAGFVIHMVKPVSIADLRRAIASLSSAVK